MTTSSNQKITALSSLGVDIGKNVFHLVGFDRPARLRFAARSTAWPWSTNLRSCRLASSAWRRA